MAQDPKEGRKIDRARVTLITATHNRSQLLATYALPSVLAQTDRQFEWIIVNDGGDPATRILVEQLRTDLAIHYLEIDHAAIGFSLCHARNAGLAVASGDLISYLDDDNAIAPTFIEQVQHFFDQHPDVQCAMVQQSRRRDVVQADRVIKLGTPFISPTTASVQDLIEQRQLFDSNGFVHRSHSQLYWNPDFRVFADYEFLLQCLSLWGEESYRLIQSVLVEYVQRSDGVIGQSSYGQWAEELRQLLNQAKLYAVLNQEAIEVLERLIEKWTVQYSRNRILPGFQE